jgi:hypothetical protein
MEKSAPVRHTKLAYVDSVAKPPREVRRQQMKYGTAKAARSSSSSASAPVKQSSWHRPDSSEPAQVSIKQQLAAGIHHVTPVAVEAKSKGLLIHRVEV